MTIDTKELKTKVKETTKKVTDRVKHDVKEVTQFVQNNPEATAAICGLGVAACKKTATMTKARSEQQHREKTVWDAQSGQWYLLKRPMTNSQKSEFARRKACGERADQILISMRLL